MNIRELLERQADRYRDKIFLYFKDEEITYQDFNARANRIGNALKKMGIRKGDRVSLMAPNSPMFLYTWMGINKIGGVEVPINTPFKEEEVEDILHHSEAVCLVIHQDYYPMFNRIRKDDLPDLKEVVFYGDEPPPRGVITFNGLHPAD